MYGSPILFWQNASAEQRVKREEIKIQRIGIEIEASVYRERPPPSIIIYIFFSTDTTSSLSLSHANPLTGSLGAGIKHDDGNPWAGCWISSVDAGGAAGRAGVQWGDVIVDVGGVDCSPESEPYLGTVKDVTRLLVSL